MGVASSSVSCLETVKPAKVEIMLRYKYDSLSVILFIDLIG